MLEPIAILFALLVVAAARHALTRATVRRYAAAMHDAGDAMKRAAKRFEETPPQTNDEWRQVMRDEGVRYWPMVAFFLHIVSVRTASLAVVWMASLWFGGVLATNVWWAGPVAVAVLAPVAIKTASRELDSRADGAWSSVHVIIAMMLPVAFVYLFAPLGVVVFAFVAQFVEWLASRNDPEPEDGLGLA